MRIRWNPLENPAETFGKLTRVARNEIAVFVRKRDDASASSAVDEALGLRQAFRKAADELGYPLPPREWDWRVRFKNEAEFLSTFPPSELVVVVQDVQVVTTLGQRLSFFEKRAYAYPTGISEDVFLKVIERVKSSVDAKKEIRYRRVEQLAIWRLPH